MSKSKKNRLSRKHNKRKNKAQALRYGGLEPRKLLATVTTPTEAALRDAIEITNQSATDNTIDFTFSNQNIFLQSGQLNILDDLTINGNNNTIAVDNDEFRVLNVTSTVADRGQSPANHNVTLNSLKIAQGRTDGENEIDLSFNENFYSGGGIRFNSTGTLTLDNSQLYNNGAIDFGSKGGGIFAVGPVILQNNTLIDNNYTGLDKLFGDSGELAGGGGVFSETSVTVNNSTVSNNRTFGYGAGGAGIASFGDVILDNGSLVSGNYTDGRYSDGGGVFAGGFKGFGAGSLYESANVIVRNGSIVENNHTKVRFSKGGGIAASGNVTIESGSIVRNNRTEGKQSHGGGIYAGRELIIDNSTLSDNHTEGGTTKLAEVVCKLGVELAKEVVGSVLPANKVIDIVTSIYDALALANEFTNVVDLDPCPEAFGSGGYGGGAAGRLITVRNGSLVANNYTDGYGASGGALFSLGNISITDSSVTGNETRQNQSKGGAVFASQELTLANSTVSNNRTLNTLSAGGALAANPVSGKVIIENSLVTGNHTAGTGAGGSNSKGGAVFASEVEIRNSELTNNRATGRRSAGGAVFGEDSVFVSDSIFDGNYTTGDTADLAVGGSSFLSRNQSGGGAIASKEVTALGTTFSNNFVSGDEADGGAIYGVNLSLVNSTIASNFASDDEADGGGVWAFQGSISQSTITGNLAGNKGGGVFSLFDLSFVNNVAIGNLALDLDDDSDTSPGNDLHIGSGFDGELTALGANIGHRPGLAGVDVWAENFSGPLLTPANPGDVFSSTTSMSGTNGSGNTVSTLSGDLSNNLGLRVGPNSTIIQTVALNQSTSNPALDASSSVADLINLPSLLSQFFDQDQRNFSRGADFAGVDNGAPGEFEDLGAVEEYDPSSLFTVTNSNDSGAGSLRSAIINANTLAGTDTITFDNSSAPISIQLLTPLPTITESVNLIGTIDSGQHSTIKGTTSGSRIFTFTPAIGHFQIESLSLEDGRTTAAGFGGGAIRSFSNGKVILTNSFLKNNRTEGPNAEGGAVFAEFGSVILNNTEVENNTTAGSYAHGGAISANVVRANGSDIRQNSTSGPNAGGGAIYGGFGAFIVDSDLYSNSTTGDDARGGAIYSAFGDVEIESSILESNSTNGNGAPGGAVRAVDIEVDSSVLRSNSTDGQGGGGALHGTRLTVENSVIEFNTTVGQTSVGGGLFAGFSLDLVNSSVIGNSTSGNNSSGGGVFTLGESTIVSSTISDNHTGGANAHGAGIAGNLGSITLTSSTVTGNSVGSTSSNGGGIYIYAGYQTEVTDSIVLGNFSNASSGTAHEIFGATSFGGQNIVGENASDFDASGISNVQNAATTAIFYSTTPTMFDSNGDGTANAVAAGHTTGTPQSLGGISILGVNQRTIALNPSSINPALDGTDAPINLFSFEGNADDGFGGNNGTLVGGLTADSPGFDGVSENAIDIGGDGTKYVQLANPLTIGDKSHTVEAWIKVPQTGLEGLASGERVGVILGNFGNSTLNVNWEIHDDGQMRVFWKHGERNIFGEKDLRDGEWHHIAFVRDTVANEFRFYVDGVEDTITGTNTAGSDFTFTQPSRIGQDARTSTPIAFHGSIDELTIHEVALTEEQIRARAGFDNRGTDFSGESFDRVVSPPGLNSSPQMDIGAFESTAEVASLVVTTLEDTVDPLDGVTSLREAVTFANTGDADGDGEAFDEITFSPVLAGGTLSLVSGELNVTEGLLINATDAERIIIDAGNQSRVINFISAADELELVNLTLIRGETTGNGGAINSTSSGLVQLFGTRVSQSSASTGGGGIFANGTVELYDSVVDGNETTNSTAQGGGVLATGEIIAINSTLYANETLGTSAEGGALAGLGGITLYNSAVVSNTAGGSFGGGLYTGSSTLPINVNNSIVLGNSSSASSYSEIDDFGPINFGGHNIVGENAATFLTAGFSNVENAPLGSVFVDSQLGGVLSDTILPVIELVPAQTNPALDAGDDSLAASADALGNLRVINLPTVAEETGGNFIDLGPYELQLTEEELPSLVVDTNLDIVDPFDLHTSLREAIIHANATDAGFFENGDADGDGNVLDTITFAARAGDFFETARTISLSSGLPKITSDLAISGNGESMLTIDALGNGRIFEFGSSETGTFVVEGMTLSGGDAGTGSGGAILLNDPDDRLVIDGVRFTQNFANGGGALSVTGSQFEIFNSSFIGNTANFSGSAIHALGNALGWITSTTVSSNVSGNGSGAILMQAGNGESGSVNLRNVTVADNIGNGFQAFAFTGGNAILSAANTIFANNTGSNVVAGGSGTGAFLTQGHNISDDGSAGFLSSDLTNTDPMLTPIDFTADQLFHRLDPASPAIDAGTNNSAIDINGNSLTTDQRGLERYFDGDNNGTSTVDIGAIEAQEVRIVGEHIFYNNSSYDTSSDSDAIDTSKEALRPGETASFKNYTGHADGINGIAIDLFNPINLIDFDFELKFGNTDNVDTWTTLDSGATIIDRTVIAGAGVNGSDRVILEFADGAIKNGWLQVKVVANEFTGLTNAEVFYFGNWVGDVTGPEANGLAITNATDASILSANFSPIFPPPPPLPTSDVLDLDKDGRVTSSDASILSANFTPIFPFGQGLKMITPFSLGGNGSSLVAGSDDGNNEDRISSASDRGDNGTANPLVRTSPIQSSLTPDLSSRPFVAKTDNSIVTQTATRRGDSVTEETRTNERLAIQPAFAMHQTKANDQIQSDSSKRVCLSSEPSDIDKMLEEPDFLDDVFDSPREFEELMFGTLDISRR